MKKNRVEPDAHAEFDDLYGPDRPAPRQDRAERMRIIEALSR